MPQDGRSAPVSAGLFRVAFPMLAAALASSPAAAQRASENVVTQAQDAFGLVVGNERTGLYTDTDVRGFNPIVAGNARIDGLYFDRQSLVSSRLIEASTIRVGLTAQNYPFVAPSGIVDYRLRALRNDTAASVGLTAGPFGTWQADFDVQAPLAEGKLLVGVGATLREEELAPGDAARVRSVAILADWRPSPALVVRPFWSVATARGDLVFPRFTAATPDLPPQAPRRYTGQPWTGAGSDGINYGVVADGRLPQGWTLRFGAFRSILDEQISFSDLYAGVDATGVGSRVVTAQASEFRSTSGEIRVSNSWTLGDVRHVVLLGARARRRDGAYGGVQRIGLGRQRFGEATVAPEPAIRLGPRNDELVKQASLEVGYELHLARRADIAVGLQSTDYSKRVATPSAGASRTDDQSLLVNGTAAVRVSRTAAVYAGYATGLEESGNAPETALNFPETLPASHTWQVDGGVRWDVTPQLRVVVGAFELHRPYFNLDAGRRFVRLGDVVNRGVEASISGRWEQLTLLFGAVASRPRVRAEGAAAVIGPRPVSLAETNLRLSGDYRLSDKRTSFDMNLIYVGARPTDTANLIKAPAYTTLDFGMRRRFRIEGHPVTFRAQVANVTNAVGLRVTSGGALQPIDPRRVIVTLLADF